MDALKAAAAALTDDKEEEKKDPDALKSLLSLMGVSKARRGADKLVRKYKVKKDWRLNPDRWWDRDEQRLLPDADEVQALRDIWGSTGGRLSKWKDQVGWKAPPPKKGGEPEEEEKVEMKRIAGKWVAVKKELPVAVQIERAYGAELQFKPKFGIVWQRGFVVKLDLHQNGLSGKIPEQLAAVSESARACVCVI